MSKLSDFLSEKKIDSRRLLIASQHLEGLRPEDRAIRLTERIARKSEDPPEKKGTRTKPRSGRPVTTPTLKAALEGKVVSGPQKTRIVRAINRILEQRKQEPVDLRTLF